MAVRKRDIMSLFLLGCLYFHIVTTPANCEQPGSDSNIAEITEEYYDAYNCTLSNARAESCRCSREAGDCCLMCCLNAAESESRCCYCYDCSLCRHEQHLQLLTMTRVSVSILFGFGIFGLIIVYCKICRRSRELARERCAIMQQEQQMSMYCSTIDGLRERPPPYGEVCGAPPVFMASHNSTPSLYAVLYNRACMQEAPPSYPETPKQERTDRFNESRSSPPTTQYI
ncbi:hypothetical protein DMN91_000091 [Ooceraea biroi]|uniref:Uncharacterized protein n=1 Tax=Ooceraea biroi TaxID=2015173 RepID=A0A3L8E0V7_OOCBI|nr:uncharacterized protein LOC105278019 isoform X1 [Ooceraea biroi]RLU26297.1 hypothetical protein DMN91_000091 [Ooceraea biroi]